MKDAVLITLADKNFIPQAKQLFSSAYWNGGWQGDFLLLAHEDVPEGELEWFEEKGIAVFKCKRLTARNRIGYQHPPVVLDKFYLFTPFFKQWRNVVFLDADMIVEASIEKLARIEGGFAAAPTTEISLKEEFRRGIEEDLFDELQKRFPLEGEAFNTGVMAFDTAIVKNDTFDNIFALYERFQALNAFGDEGTFNLFFYKKWERLSRLYNTYPFYTHDAYGLPYRKIKPIIFHCGWEPLPKPWSKESYLYQEWSDNLRKAEMMDISKPQKPARTWLPEEEARYERMLRARHPWRVPKRKMRTAYASMRSFARRAGRSSLDSLSSFFKRSLSRCRGAIDPLVGKTGIILKKLSPRLYRKLGGKN